MGVLIIEEDLTTSMGFQGFANLCRRLRDAYNKVGRGFSVFVFNF
jgi:hypothetical protein